MAKTYKQRVRIGTNASATPIYKWATGHSVDELNDSIVRLYVEFGLITRFIPPEGSINNSKKHIPFFKEYASKWFETYKVPKLKPTTLQGYRSNMKLHLYPSFGNIQLSEISIDRVQEFLNERSHLAKNTLHTMFVLFSEIMDAAVEDQLIPSNPAKSKRINIPSAKKSERIALTPVQLKTIISDISTKLEDVSERRFISLMLFTGMRRGEVLGLKWEDIDFMNRIIKVQRAVAYTTNQPIVTSPKTCSGKRIIPLDERLSKLLEPHEPNGYILGDTQPLTQMVVRRILRNVNKRIDLFGATPHVFRHSYISALAEAGVDLKTLQEISGHANISTTIGVYVHTRQSLIQEAGERVGQLLT